MRAKTAVGGDTPLSSSKRVWNLEGPDARGPWPFVQHRTTGSWCVSVFDYYYHSYTRLTSQTQTSLQYVNSESGSSFGRVSTVPLLHHAIYGPFGPTSFPGLTKRPHQVQLPSPDFDDGSGTGGVFPLINTPVVPGRKGCHCDGICNFDKVVLLQRNWCFCFDGRIGHHEAAVAAPCPCVGGTSHCRAGEQPQKSRLNPMCRSKYLPTTVYHNTNDGRKPRLLNREGSMWRWHV